MKPPEAPIRAVSKPSNRLLLGLLGAVLAGALAGCGSGAPLAGGRPVVRPSELPGWRLVDDGPGIAELAPDVSGLERVRRVDSPALVRDGDAVRATTFEFASERTAAAALGRARAETYAALLVHELHGPIRRARAGAVGYRLDVGRPAEPGRDTVEIYAVRRGRALVIVELVSGDGFDRDLRDRILELVSR